MRRDPRNLNQNEKPRWARGSVKSFWRAIRRSCGVISTNNSMLKELSMIIPHFPPALDFFAYIWTACQETDLPRELCDCCDCREVARLARRGGRG